MDRRRLLMDGGGGSSGTSRIEYLESDGNQYIDTGHYLSSVNWFTYSFEITDLSRLAGVMGARKGDNNGTRFNIFTQNEKLRIDIVQNTSTYVAINEGERYDFHYIPYYSTSTNAIRINENAYSNTNNRDTSSNMYLFTFSDGGKPTGYGGAPQRVYGYKEYGPGWKLLMDLIPYKYNGEGCMYDRISGELFFNNGTGNFICGPEVPDDYLGMKTFYIRDAKTSKLLTYSVPEDMTWQDFVNSSYNNLGLQIISGTYPYIARDSYTMADASFLTIVPIEPIGRNMLYRLWY